MACDEDKQRRRNELNQPDQPEIERVPGQVVHLPCHGNRLHLQPDGAGYACDPIECERPMAPKGRAERVV